MWFDAHAKLKEIAGYPAANLANPANLDQGGAPGFAKFAEFATPSTPKTESAPAQADGLETDPAAYLAFLREQGPHSYGAVARALGWGATRALRAEAELREAGEIRHHKNGKSATQ